MWVMNSRSSFDTHSGAESSEIASDFCFFVCLLVFLALGFSGGLSELPSSLTSDCVIEDSCFLAWMSSDKDKSCLAFVSVQ